MTTPSWEQVIGSCCATFAAVQLADGSVAVMGTDQKIYYTKSLTPVSWTSDPYSCCGYGLAQLADGRIAVNGSDKKIYTKTLDPSSRWAVVEGSGDVISIATYA